MHTHARPLFALLLVPLLQVAHLDQLGEVPGVPLPHAHDEGVNVLVQCVEQRDGLDDHVVHLVHVELHLGAAVRVRQAQLRAAQVCAQQCEPGRQATSRQVSRQWTPASNMLPSQHNPCHAIDFLFRCFLQ
eukprot:GHRQ01038792.1.p2 GENE.GHRQ01038792.1~~GHRQ01038792.1.p2  ORF type:complete len:131 (-),score=21.48 GHRQ01038792.1:131-523(-)